MSSASFYVYYKVEAARLTELRSAVQAMFATLQRECGVRGRWLHRRDDPATYMEVYEGVSPTPPHSSACWPRQASATA